jgi:hypothetical protein
MHPSRQNGRFAPFYSSHICGLPALFENPATDSQVNFMAAPEFRSRQRRTLVAATCLVLLLGPTQTGVAKAPPSRGQIIPISAALCEDMKIRHVLGPNAPVGCERLRLLKFSYLDFAGAPRDDGEIVVMDAAASHVLRIFNSLREMRFPIAKAKLMNNYEGNDLASMSDNNSSGFNDRKITNGDSISLHAYGLAIDINPVQNPFVVRLGSTLDFQPPSGVEFANRLNDRPWKDSRRGMAESVINVFADNGFLIWGGYWDSPTDYQHFQVGRKMAERLASMPAREAEAMFNRVVDNYRTCRRTSREEEAGRTKCIMIGDPTAGQLNVKQAISSASSGSPELRSQ